jgi:hypothetical protein
MHLSRNDSYVNPDMYINIFSKYYDCNIVVFEVDENHPDGEIMTPRYSIAHLGYKMTNKNTVVIVKMQNESEWGYQCEIVCKYNSGGKFGFIFERNDNFVEAVIQAVELSNIVYITSSESSYVKYIPVVTI